MTLLTDASAGKPGAALAFGELRDLLSVLRDGGQLQRAQQDRVRTMPDTHRALLADAHVVFDVPGELGDIELAHRGEIFLDATAAVRVGLAPCDQ